MRTPTPLVLVVVISFASACPPAPECEEQFVGSKDAPPEIEIVHRSARGQLYESAPGGDVELFRPPQGGKVFLTGARVRNVDACGLRIQAALRDPCTQRVIGLEGRPFPVRETEDGWLEPLNPRSLSSWANVPACPSRAATRQVDGQMYSLEVEVEDRAGRKAQANIDVVPRCVQQGFQGEQCRCECREDYSLGDRCEETDGGVASDGGPDVPVDAGTAPDAGVTLICPEESP